MGEEPLRFRPRSDRPLRVLCLGAHCDDIEIGCGATLMKLRESDPDADVRWAIFSGDEARRDEARASAVRFLGPGGEKQIHFESFRDGYLPTQAAAVKDAVEALAARVEPDLIFTHRREDLHQDHRLVAELSWNTWRRHTILEYEIPKYEGDLGRPNVFVSFDRSHAERKVDAVMECYASQRAKRWFEPETLLALMRIRGAASGGPERYAEAFTARKLALEWSAD